MQIASSSRPPPCRAGKRSVGFVARTVSIDLRGMESESPSFRHNVPAPLLLMRSASIGAMVFVPIHSARVVRRISLEGFVFSRCSYLDVPLPSRAFTLPSGHGAHVGHRPHYRECLRIVPHRCNVSPSRSLWAFRPKAKASLSAHGPPT